MRDEIGPGVRSERMEHKMMVETVDPQQNDSVLKEWRGADARVWRFHASLNRLALRLDRPGAPQHIYLVMVGCKHFVGSFGWKSADVSITFDESLDVHEGPYLVVDKGAGFQVRCSSVWIAQSLPKDLHMDFDEFLADEPSE